MPQLGFADGYETDPKKMDKRLREFDSKYDNPTGDQGGQYLDRIQNLLSQVEQVRNQPMQQAMPAQPDYTPQVASALAGLSAAAGTLGGETSDITPVERFAQQMQEQQREQQAMQRQDVESERQARLGELSRKLELAKAMRGEQKYAQDVAMRQRGQEAEQEYKQQLLAARREEAEAGREQRRSEFEARQAEREADREARQAMLAARPVSTKTIQTVDEQGNPVTQLVDAAGEVVKSYPGQPKPKRQPSQSQALATGFGKRIEAADEILSRLEQEGFDRASYKSGLMETFLPESMKPSELQEQNQAERNFVNAVLRRESGAAIAPSEFESAEKQYFPRAGDSPQVIANKAQNRKQALASLRAEAGDFWEQVPSIAYREVGEQESPMMDTAYASPGSQGELDEVSSLMTELRRKAAAGDQEAQNYLDSLGG